jgi:hypothetical protein
MNTFKKILIGSIFLFIILGIAAVLPGVVQAQYYGSCTLHAYRLCVGNSIYWYSSCGNQQELYFNCTNGQICQYGECVIAPQIPNNIIVPTNNYVAYSRISCNGNSLYWYDSLGAVSGLNRNCADTNSCTMDTCSGTACINTLRCDGSTCVAGSDDYKKYCPTAVAGAETVVVQNNCGNGLCEPNLGETNANCSNDCKLNTTTIDTNPAPVQAAAAVSSPKAASGFSVFLKRWYLWILGALVLIFLFVAVFKRLSSEA